MIIEINFNDISTLFISKESILDRFIPRDDLCLDIFASNDNEEKTG